MQEIPKKLILAGFSDASEKAFAACAYLCSVSSSGTAVSFLSSKTKVAPVKTVSLPKLELCGAVLLVSLMKSVETALKLPDVVCHAWTDSTIVLAWINSHSSRWKTFVANRISTIQSSKLQIKWQHVSSNLNPADSASRGLSAEDLADFQLWWNRPEFLKDTKFIMDSSSYPIEPDEEVMHAEENHFQILLYHSLDTRRSDPPNTWKLLLPYLGSSSSILVPSVPVQL